MTNGFRKTIPQLQLTFVLPHMLFYLSYFYIFVKSTSAILDALAASLKDTTMKRLTIILSLLLSISVYGQTNQQIAKWEKQILNSIDLYKQEYKDSLEKYDLSTLWTHSDNSIVYGYIGDNYQRIRIKIISATKDKNNSNYNIIGKSMVKTNICQFSGTIKITNSRTFKNMHWGVDDEFKNKGIKKQGILIAEYHFTEDSTQTHSGTFDGIISTSWYIDKSGQLKYDDIEKNSDSYCNNQFVGTWKGYKMTTKRMCNWGDYRIPFSGDLDIGEGEFSPADKYLQNGWQRIRDAYTSNNEQARQLEEKQWWK